MLLINLPNMNVKLFRKIGNYYNFFFFYIELIIRINIDMFFKVNTFLLCIIKQDVAIKF